MKSPKHRGAEYQYLLPDLCSLWFSDRGPLKSIFMFLMFFFLPSVLNIVFISQLGETLGTVLFLFYSVENNEARFNNYSLAMSRRD